MFQWNIVYTFLCRHLSVYKNSGYVKDAAGVGMLMIIRGEIGTQEICGWSGRFTAL
jgi:hypothetical protein